MLIRIRYAGGLNRPTFICDHCDKSIEPKFGDNGASIGNYLYVDQRIIPSDFSDKVFVVHKACTLPFIAALGVPPCTCVVEELEVLPVYLLAGLGVSLKRAAARAGQFARGSE